MKNHIGVGMVTPAIEGALAASGREAGGAASANIRLLQRLRRRGTSTCGEGMQAALPEVAAGLGVSVPLVPAA